MKHLSRGFTLIEMAIVLVVIGLASTGAVKIIGPLLDNDRAALTRERMDAVEDALTVYAMRFRCLPCPADGALASDVAVDNDHGRSFAGGALVAGDCVSGAAVCQASDAAVPWRTLGISEEDASDGWGTRLRYAVAAGTPCGTPTLIQAGGMGRCSGGTYPAGGITVDNLDVAGGPETTTAAYVLFSVGKDRAGGRRQTTGVAVAASAVAAQAENTDDANFTFSQGGYNGTTAGFFDDILVFRSAPILIQMCGEGACGNP